MAEYETEYTLESYGAGVIQVEIPTDVLIYLLEIDVSKSKFAKFFDVIVLGNEDILYAGRLSEEVVQILFNSKKHKIEEINIIMRPSQQLGIDTTKWYIFNDWISFSIHGVYEVPNVEIEETQDFDGDDFQSDWV